MSEITGRWELAAAAAANDIHHDYDDGDTVVGEIRLPLDEFNRRWLGGEALGVVRPLMPLTGLTLTIAEDGTFTETGTAEVEWFDDEGVLEMKARPFDGTVVTAPGGTFLITEEGVQAAEFAAFTDLRLRRDDGDTGITDIVTVSAGEDGDVLRRTMSMVTDGMYPGRVWLEYRRA